MLKLYNLLVRILSGFIISSKKRKEFRNRYKAKIAFAKVVADKSNIINIPKNRNIKITVIGKNNVINIDSEIDFDSNINIFLVGNNNNIKIDKSFPCNLVLTMGSTDNRFINNSSFHFGESYAWEISAIMMENNTKIDIGDGCMISNNIEMRCTDDHSVLDMEGNVINKASDITIGNHVWLCKDVLILKNTTIPDDCIVGAKSVIAKRFSEPNCAICGNPAKVVKTGVTWDGARPDLYSVT